MKNFTFIPSNSYSIEVMHTIGFAPKIQHAQIDETLLKKETPVKYIERITKEKAQSIWQEGINVFAVHKAVFVGRRLITVPQNIDEARNILKLYSGQNHTIYAGICLIKQDGTTSQKHTFTRVKMRNLPPKSIEEFVSSNEWQNQIGGYNPSGIMQKHIIKIVGSHTGFFGCPSYEAFNLINQM